jgi:hypothetical protein
VYATRWWVLAVWSAFALLQTFLWNFYGPVASALHLLYGWSEDEIEKLPNASNFAYALALPAISALVGKRGVRPAALLGAASMLLSVALGAVFFWLPPTQARHPVYYGLPLASQLLNGIAAPVPNITVSLVSERWFPPRERTFATSMLVATCFAGSILSFTLPIKFIAGVHTTHLTSSSSSGSSFGGEGEAESALHGLRIMYGGGVAATVAVCAAVCCHFPERPPSAPSPSATQRAEAAEWKAGQGAAGLLGEWGSLARSRRVLLFQDYGGLSARAHTHATMIYIMSPEM